MSHLNPIRVVKSFINLLGLNQWGKVDKKKLSVTFHSVRMSSKICPIIWSAGWPGIVCRLITNEPVPFDSLGCSLRFVGCTSTSSIGGSFSLFSSTTVSLIGATSLEESDDDISMSTSKEIIGSVSS